MSITNVEELAQLASTSVASYATIVSNAALASALSNSLGGAKMAPSQATAFDARYDFLSQQPNIGGNGFSATVFRDAVTGQKVLAIRGTEIPSDIINDVGLTDLLGIGGAGFAHNQGVELYRYWKRLTTVPGQAVAYSDDELARLFVMQNAIVATLVQQLPSHSHCSPRNLRPHRDGPLVAVQRRTGAAPKRSLRAHRGPSTRGIDRRQCGSCRHPTNTACLRLPIRLGQTRSITSAIPWPTPMHIVHSA